MGRVDGRHWATRFPGAARVAADSDADWGPVFVYEGVSTPMGGGGAVARDRGTDGVSASLLGRSETVGSTSSTLEPGPDSATLWDGRAQ